MVKKIKNIVLKSLDINIRVLTFCDGLKNDCDGIISTDGETWRGVGLFTLPKGPGSSEYEGFSLPEFGIYTTKFVLFSVKSNYGSQCSGLSEVRFNLTDRTTAVEDLVKTYTIKTYHNPFTDRTKIRIGNLPIGQTQYQIIDILGKVLKQGIEQKTNDDLIIEIHA